MNNIKWIKLTVNMFDDEKIKIIQAMPEGDTILLIWVRLILLAGKTNEGGYVYVSDGIPYTEEMLSIIINKPIQIIRLALDTFTRLGMIETDDRGIYLINFEKYQSVDKMLEIREYNKLAQRKHREKVKSQLLSMTSQLSQDIDIDKNKNIKEEIYKEEKFDLIQQFKSNLTPTDYEMINEVIDKYSLEQFKEAIEISKSNNAKTIKYLLQVLKNPIRNNKRIMPRPKWMDEDLTRKDVKLTDEEQRELDEIIKGS